MDVTLTGVGGNSNVEAQVDATFQASRVNLRPLEYAIGGRIGGHYMMAATFSTTAAGLPVAGQPLFTMRWSDNTLLYVLKRVSISAGVTTVYSTAQVVDFDIIAARSYTANSTGGTSLVLASQGQKTRTNYMSGSQLSSTGNLQISNGAGLTGGSFVLDTLPFGYAVVLNTTSTVGAAGPPVDIYNLRDFGQHPMLFGPNEGFIIRNGVSFAGTGVTKIGFTIYWSEVPAY